MLDITAGEFDINFYKWKNGGLIQDCFPTLNADEREFVMSGVTPEEYENVLMI